MYTEGKNWSWGSLSPERFNIRQSVNGASLERLPLFPGNPSIPVFLLWRWGSKLDLRLQEYNISLPSPQISSSKVPALQPASAGWLSLWWAIGDFATTSISLSLKLKFGSFHPWTPINWVWYIFSDSRSSLLRQGGEWTVNRPSWYRERVSP